MQGDTFLQKISKHPKITLPLINLLWMALQLQKNISEYDLVGVIAAGQTHDYQLSSNQCFQIMTGASIPTNTIKVMRQEFCELNQNKMIIKNEDAENILRKGKILTKAIRLFLLGKS